jgi:N-acyl-D-aspartate/D-glutamate deacylase
MASTFDLVIRNGLIFDGSGLDPFGSEIVADSP